MAEVKEKKISPGAIVAIGLGLGGIAGAGALLYLATRAKAMPPAPPENIVLSDLVIEPSIVYVGEPVSITVTATNIGETADSYEVTCQVE